MFHNIIVADKGFKDLNPMQFGYENCDKGKYFGPAIRTHWLIHYVVSGYGEYTIDGKNYNIGPHEMFIIPPYVETFYKASDEEPWSYIWIGFTTQTQLPAPLPDTLYLPEAHNIFTAMKACDKYETGRSTYLSARLWDLFALIQRDENRPADYVEQALDFIHSEYMNEITVEELAHRLSLDRTYFSTLFKRRTGISPKQYLLNYRMNTAASLLTVNKTSVSVAACSVGYNDIFNFSKMFKRHFGMSPNEYVKAHKKHK